MINKNNDLPLLSWQNNTLILCISFILLTLLFYFFGYLDNLDSRIVGIDSVYYFSYLRSLVFDGDFVFTNELTQLYPTGANQLTELGVPRNNFSIGPALFWLPLYLLAHFFTLIYQWLGGDLSPDGYSTLYQLSVTISNSFYVVLGLVFNLKILKLYVSQKSALFAVLSILLASQITFYIWIGSAMSHNVSFAATSIYLYLFLTRGTTRLTALLAALMILSRWQNAIFLLPIFFAFLYEITASIKAKDVKWISILRKHVYFGVVLLIGLMPQFIAWKLIFGEFFLIPQGSGFFELDIKEIYAVLFDLHHGLFSWHPMLLFGLVGLLLMYKTHRLLAISFLMIFIIQLILNASVSDWWAGWSFGHRRFISLLPIFAIGLAFVFNEAKNKYLKIALTIILIALSIWNQLFIYQYHHALIPRGGTITHEQMFSDKFKLARLTKIQQHHLNSLKHLSDGDIDNMKVESNLAYILDPELSNSLLIHGLACLLTDDKKEGKKLFHKWHEIDQTDILAKYGLAHHLIKENNMKSASELFEVSNCLPNEIQLCQSLASTIINSTTELLDKNFWELYRDRTDLLYSN